MRPILIAILLLVAAPVASAALFPGDERVGFEISETGSYTARSAHDLDGWVRRYAIDVEYTRVGVYELQRAAGVDAFTGGGEEFVEATGALEITLDDQGVDSGYHCTLAYSRTVPRGASLFGYEGSIVALAGEGILDDEVWECELTGNEVVHGGSPDVAVSVISFDAAEGLDSGTFPADLAVLLGFADSEEEWAAEESKSSFDSTLIDQGYVELEARQGEQTASFERNYDLESSDFSPYVCGPATVDDTPSTSATCSARSEVRAKIGQPGARSPSSPTAGGAGAGTGRDAGTPQTGATPRDADTPAIGVAALFGVAAALALAVRRRG